jgi:hypothetical protein
VSSVLRFCGAKKVKGFDAEYTEKSGRVEVHSLLESNGHRGVFGEKIAIIANK